MVGAIQGSGLVEQQHSSVRLAKGAKAAPGRPRERATLMAEEGGREHLARERGDVQAHEGPPRAHRLGEGLGRHLLAAERRCSRTRIFQTSEDEIVARRRSRATCRASSDGASAQTRERVSPVGPNVPALNVPP